MKYQTDMKGMMTAACLDLTMDIQMADNLELKSDQTMEHYWVAAKDAHSGKTSDSH